jgi:hypothetical protein
MTGIPEMYTTKALFAKLNQLTEEIKQVATCLKSLRGTGWKTEIEKDSRPFIQELYQRHQKLEKEHETLLNTKWEEVI